MKCFISNRPCHCDVVCNPKSSFVISPFGYTFNEIYNNYLKALVEEILDGNCDRADQVAQIGFIMCQKICLRIQAAEYIIADVTIPNRNVFYEIGLSIGLQKKILFIGNQPFEALKKYRFIDESRYFQYKEIDDFKDPVKKGELEKLLINIDIIPLAKIKETAEKILVITDEGFTGDKHYYIQGLQKDIFVHAVNSLDYKNYNWEVNELTLSDIYDSDYRRLSSSIRDHKIIAIDTTSSNPYLYFCLGLAHSLEKDVIPMTQIPLDSNQLPFDLRGLWHIFYKEYESLVFQFKNILLQIDKEWYQEKNSDLHKNFWKSFVTNEQISLVTCARHWPRQAGRHGIEGWDYKTVALFSSFLPTIFSNLKITTTTPMCKFPVRHVNNQVINSLKSTVSRLLHNQNVILIGSTEVNDISEILLSDVNNITPYSAERLKTNGFVIVKKKDEREPNQEDTINPFTQSSFIWRSENGEEGVYEIENKEVKRRYLQPEKSLITHGILTIINNPYSDQPYKKKILVLSGFSGPSTYGISRILTSFKFKSEVTDLTNSLPHDGQITEALIRVEHESTAPTLLGDIELADKELILAKMGDNRNVPENIENISLEKIITY